MQAENPGTMRVLDLIKKHKPSSIRVTLQDGETKEVEVRGGRARWTPAARTITAYGWTRIELLGPAPKCNVLHVEDARAAAVDDGELPKGPAEQRELHLMRLMNAHADLAVQRHIEALKPTLQAMQTQVNMLAEQLIAERRASRETMESAADLAEQLARVARQVRENGGDDSELGALLGVLPQLMPLLNTLGKPAAAVKKPNGVPAKTSTERRAAPPADGAAT